MELIYALLILLFATRVAGEVAERLNQPALVGELVAGIALGMLFNLYSDTFPMLSNLSDNEVFIGITDLSILFLMLLAGTEMHPNELAQVSGKAFFIAAGGMLLPLSLGFALGWFFLPDSPMKLAQSLFVAMVLAITAVPVSVKVLMDLGKLKSRTGKTIVSAAVFDDILGLFLLAFLTAVIRHHSFPDTVAMLTLAGKAVLFLAIAGGVGHYLFPWLGRRLKRFQAQEFEFSALLIATLAYAMLAQALGMHFLLGAFLAGLFFVHQTIEPKVYHSIRRSLTTFTMGFFAPIFFASIGMHLRIGAATEIPLFVLLFVLAAFVGKIAGAGLPALAFGFRGREALTIGVGMSARGAVELIVAEVALRAGLFTQPEPAPPIVDDLFSAVVIMTLVTTLLTPVMLKSLVRS